MREKQRQILAHEAECRFKARQHWGIVRKHMRAIVAVGRDEVRARGTSSLIGHLVVEPRQNAPELARRLHVVAEDVCCGVVYARGGFRGTWDIVMMLALLWILVTLPYRVAYETEPSSTSFAYWFERLVDLFFIFDIVLNFRTTYVDHSTGKEVTDQAKIARHYLASWFLLDFFASVPIELLLQVEGAVTGDPDSANLGGLVVSSQEAKPIKLLKLGKLMRALRMIRLARSGKFAELADRVEDRCTLWGVDDFLRSTIALLKLLSLLIYVCHLFACIFVAIADHALAASDTNWYRSLGLCDDVPPEAVAECLPKLYTTALYWAVTTMTTVGYGDITPTSDGEKEFFMVAMILGGAYFAYMIALMPVTISQTTRFPIERTAHFHSYNDHFRLSFLCIPPCV